MATKEDRIEKYLQNISATATLIRWIIYISLIPVAVALGLAIIGNR